MAEPGLSRGITAVTAQPPHFIPPFPSSENFLSLAGKKLRHNVNVFIGFLGTGNKSQSPLLSFL